METKNLISRKALEKLLGISPRHAIQTFQHLEWNLAVELAKREELREELAGIKFTSPVLLLAQKKQVFDFIFAEFSKNTFYRSEIFCLPESKVGAWKSICHSLYKSMEDNGTDNLLLNSLQNAFQRLIGIDSSITDSFNARHRPSIKRCAAPDNLMDNIIKGNFSTYRQWQDETGKSLELCYRDNYLCGTIEVHAFGKVFLFPAPKHYFYVGGFHWPGLPYSSNFANLPSIVVPVLNKDELESCKKITPAL